MTSKYTVTFKSSAKKSLKKINKVDQVRILKAISALTTNPYPPGIKRLPVVMASSGFIHATIALSTP